MLAGVPTDEAFAAASVTDARAEEAALTGETRE
jgi:hypothetical protein